MTNVLFTFRRAVKVDGQEKPVLQDNYINPFLVISAFWEYRPDGKVQLNVFTLTYTYTLRQELGNAFLAHWENVLRLYCLGSGRQVPLAQEEPRERKPRPVLDATAVEDIDLTEAAEWQQQ